MSSKKKPMSKPDWPPNVPPSLPPEVIQAAKEATLVIFVGVGVSRLMGCPSWDKLSDEILKKLASKGEITYGDIQQLSHLDAKKRLSIALEIAAPDHEELASLIQPKRPKGSKIYEYLKKIGCVYVTTNYDRYLDVPKKELSMGKSEQEGDSKGITESELICLPHQFKSSHLRNPGCVIHLHGSVDVQKSMVMTTPDYLKHYNNSEVKQFLSELFEHYTVLFIGYGLEEWEILEHILRVENKKKTRFMLTGFYLHQKKTCLHLYNYFKTSFNVELIPFPLDFLEYKQLEKIIEDWSGKLKVGTPLAADELNFVLEVANE